MRSYRPEIITRNLLNSCHTFLILSRAFPLSGGTGAADDFYWPFLCFELSQAGCTPQSARKGVPQCKSWPQTCSWDNFHSAHVCICRWCTDTNMANTLEWTKEIISPSIPILCSQGITPRKAESSGPTMENVGDHCSNKPCSNIVAIPCYLIICWNHSPKALHSVRE